MVGSKRLGPTCVAPTGFNRPHSIVPTVENGVLRSFVPNGTSQDDRSDLTLNSAWQNPRVILSKSNQFPQRVNLVPNGD